MGPLILTLVIFGFIAATSLRIVPKGEEFIKMRLGRQAGVLKPGLNFIIPFIDATIRRKTGPQTESLQVGKNKVDVTYTVKDALELHKNVADLRHSLKMAAENLLSKHSGIAGISSIDRKRIESELVRDIGDIFRPWGVEVSKVELA